MYMIGLPIQKKTSITEEHAQQPVAAYRDDAGRDVDPAILLYK